MLDISQLRRDLPAVVARLETRKTPQPFLDVACFSALEAERKTRQTRQAWFLRRALCHREEAAHAQRFHFTSPKHRDIQRMTRCRPFER